MLDRLLRAGSLIVVGLALAAAAQAQVPTPRLPAAGSSAPGGEGLSIETAQRMARAALAACRANRFQVTVVIVDREGAARLMLRDDDAAPHSPESAQRKAYTAASFDRATAELGEMGAANRDFAWLEKLDKVIFVGGGLPIRAGGRVIGGIGVAGGIGPGTDEVCAKAGLAAIGSAN